MSMSSASETTTRTVATPATTLPPNPKGPEEGAPYPRRQSDPHGASLKIGSSFNDNSDETNHDSCIRQQHDNDADSRGSVIRILPQCVVERIAAGECVQRARSAIKELIENALDAAATEIVVTVDARSWQRFSVADNGTGFATQQDLQHAVHRHATSKLKQVDDLNRLTTFGFRGEALASLRVVSSRLIITTRSSSHVQAAGWRMVYHPDDPDAAVHTTTTTTTTRSQPTLCARKPGTTVTVENLFQSLPQRRASLQRNAAAEYQAVVALVQSYAIEYAARGVGIVCQKMNTIDFSSTQAVQAVRTALLSQQQQQQQHQQRPQHENSGCSNHTNNNNSKPTRPTPSGEPDPRGKDHAILDLNHDDHGEAAAAAKPQLHDLQRQATQHVMALVYGSTVRSHLIEFESAHVAANPIREEDANKVDDDDEQESAQLSLPRPNRAHQPTGIELEGEDNMESAPDNKSHKNVVVATSSIAVAMESIQDRQHDQVYGPMSYSCRGMITAPAFHTSQPQRSASTTAAAMILFVNARLVDCPPLKKALEEVYGDFTKSKPILYISLTVPPHQVDVNVHPTKQLVALLHLEAIVAHLAHALRQTLLQQGHSFDASSVATVGNRLAQRQQQRLLLLSTNQNPYNRSKREDEQKGNSNDDENDSEDADKEEVDENDSQVEHATPPQPVVVQRLKPPPPTAAASRKLPPPSSMLSQQQQPASKKTKLAGSKFIRTLGATPTGALEPYLVSTQQQQQQPQQPSSGTSFGTYSAPLGLDLSQFSASSTSEIMTLTVTKEDDDSATLETASHEPNCPLAVAHSKNPGTAHSDDLDLSQPGAFAMAAARCSCLQTKRTYLLSAAAAALSSSSSADTVSIMLPKQIRHLRFRKIVPTACSYTSIQQLRKRIEKQAHTEWQAKLRQSFLVGVVSSHRSLMQCNEELVLMHHTECARQMFYQLALSRFCGGAAVARFRGRFVDIQTCIEQFIEFEEAISTQEVSVHPHGDNYDDDDDDDKQQQQGKDVMGTTTQNRYTTGALLQMLPVRETNQRLAEQAATCLWEHADMLMEYFAISLEKRDDQGIVLTGLPVLLEGYEPQPHGLPAFLFRLATEVNWQEEKSCFHNICRELGDYYAQLPIGDSDDGTTSATDSIRLQHVRHVLFPAISALLIPTKSMADDGTLCTLTSLTKLYRVFERC